jgi:hypothetical protein
VGVDFSKGNKRANRALRGRKEKILCGSQPMGLGVCVSIKPYFLVYVMHVIILDIKI